MRRPVLVAATALIVTVAAGCASTSSPWRPPADAACGLTAGTQEVGRGETLTVSRDPSPDCLNLTAGSAQLVHILPAVDTPDDFRAPAPAEVTLDDDGAFAAEITVPSDFPKGVAAIAVEPPEGCDDTKAQDCAFAVIAVEVTG